MGSRIGKDDTDFTEEIADERMMDFADRITETAVVGVFTNNIEGSIDVFC